MVAGGPRIAKHCDDVMSFDLAKMPIEKSGADVRPYCDHRLAA
jgi:hypothetical protein